MNNNKHYAAAVTSFAMWGVFSVALKSMAEFLPSTILYFRIFISVMLLLSFITIAKRRTLAAEWKKFKQFTISKKGKTTFFIAMGGLLLAVNWLVFIHVINHVNIKTASFSYFICPVLTAVLAYIFLKEKLSPIQWIAVLICALSCLLIGKDSLAEAGYSLVIASSYAFYIIVQRKSQELDKLVVLLFQLALALLIITPFFGFLVPEVPVKTQFYLGTTIIAIFFTVLPLNLQLFALQRLKSATIGILMYINPMMNFLIAVWVYNETISTPQAIGYVLILLAVVLFNWKVLQELVAKRIQ